MSEATVALVTGAARRVGRFIALELARRGADVAVHYRSSADEAQETAEYIREIGQRAVTVQADQKNVSEIQPAVENVVGQLGPIDVLVNNASIYDPTPFPGVSLEEWEENLRVNLTGPFFWAQTVAESMLERGGGVIVNLVDHTVPRKNYVAYGVSKAGLVAATKALSRELAPSVRVCGVAPGAVLLPEGTDASVKDTICKSIPLRRIGTPEDIAKAVAFLVFDTGYATGDILYIDGGRYIG